METREQKISRLEQMAKRMRKHALSMAFAAGNNRAHLGGGLSIIDITATLYGEIMKIKPDNPEWEERDRFILSKGHGVLGYYPALAERGYFSVNELKSFEANDGFLSSHPMMNVSKGIEFSSGSLGMGLSIGVGVALAAKIKKRNYKTYVLLGDGECNEGSIWEAAMAANQYKLNNLIAIIDKNNFQLDGSSLNIMNMDDITEKWESFGWDTTEIDGNNITEIYDAFLNFDNSTEKPHAVIANTVKGKGISFMENNNEWHHNRLSKKQYELAMQELGE